MACPPRAQMQAGGRLWLTVETGCFKQGSRLAISGDPTALQVCWDGFCQDLHVYRSRNCSARCNGHGVRGPRAQPATCSLGLRYVPARLGPRPKADRGPRLAPLGRWELPGPPEAGTVGDLLGVRAGGYVGRIVRCEASGSEL